VTAAPYRFTFTYIALALLLSLISGAAVLRAQRLDPNKALTQYVLDKWQRDQGLPQNSINTMLQTRDGYLWVGTYQGAARFDGQQFTVYNLANTQGLTSHGIFALLEDRKGNLWMGTNGAGVGILKDGVFTAYTTQQGLAHNTVIELYEDSRGRIWCGTRGGLSYIDSGKVVTLNEPATLGKRAVFCFAEDKAGALWMGTRSGLYVLREGKPQEISLKPYNVKNVFALMLDGQGNLWMGTDDGLLVKQGETLKRYSTAEGLSDNRINQIVTDRSGAIWIGSFLGGLNRYWRGRFESLTSKQGLDDDQIQSILEDREGNLWFGTDRGGLYRLKEGKFTNYGTAEGMGADIAFCVAQARDGGLWVGTYNGGLSHYANGAFGHITKANGLSGNYIRSVYEAPDGALWISCYSQGVDVYKNGRVIAHYDNKNGLPDNYVRAILPADPANAASGALWFATTNGLSYYDGQKFTNYNTEKGLTNNSILSMVVDPRGALWFGTDGGGLMCFNNGKFTTYNKQMGLTSDVVMGLYYDKFESCLWIGTNAGLDKLVDDKVVNFRTSGGVYGEAIFQIVDDGRGTLWMGSNNGVYRVSKQQLSEYATGQSKRINMQRYDRSDGMRSSECTPNGHPSAIRDDQGRIWFPTARGLSMIEPSRLALNELPPPVQIESIVVDGERRAVNGTYFEVAPGVDKIEIQYAGLCLKAPEKVQMQYRLEGFEDEWVEAGRRTTAYYTTLGPGDYTFRIKAANNDGVWNEKGATLRIVLLPRFYQTWWFRLLVLSLLMGGVYGFVQYRHRYIRARNRWLESQVTVRTKEVTQQKEAIGVQNELLYIKNNALEEKTSLLEEALDNLQRTQDLLIQSEKMAALGQLVANIAHEINTPISAVTTAARGSQRMLPSVLEKLPVELRHLNDAELEMFNSMVQQALNAQTRFSTKEEREARRALEQELKTQGIAEAGDVAAKLVMMRLTQGMEAYKMLLLRPDGGRLITLASDLVQLAQNNDLIRLAADKTARIVGALKTYAHVGITQVKQPINVLESVETVLTLYQNQLKHGVEVEMDAAPQPLVPAFADEIEQVWSNLVHNSILAMEGSGRLHIELGVTTTQEANRTRQEAYVRFTDNGKGIAAEIMPRIFEPFFTTRAKGEGSGLGLHIVKQIIDKHDGRIEVRSVPGNTTFEVFLPLN